MSLLMQALKKAEHAKQKQSNSPSTDVAEEKNPLQIQNDDVALPPQVTERVSSTANLDMLDMELSPIAIEKAPQVQSESATTEPAYSTAQPTTDFNEPEPPRSHFDAASSSQNRTDSYSENSRIESDSRSNTENLSQQLTAKMRLDQQMATIQQAGKTQLEQQKAKAVFTSKQPNANRRTLWIAVIGLVIVVLFFGGGYYYLQLTPQNSTMLVKALPIQSTPAPTAAPAPAPVAAPETVPAQEAQAAAAPAPMQAALVAQKNIEQPAANPAPSIAQPTPHKARTEQVSIQHKAAPTDGGDAIEIRQTTIDSHINPALGKAYQLFMDGDLAAAQQQYKTVLQQEPNNRDALLGMAAIAINRKLGAQAGAYYLKLLELDPSDPDAIAGLTSLQGGDPAEIESRLKKALAQNPQAGALLFALGNLYAQESRWSDAQQTYFRAYGAVPGNPDYAFNLAVSLDRLNQEKLALEFYQRALTLAQNKPGNFNKVAIEDRIRQLQSAPGS